MQVKMQGREVVVAHLFGMEAVVGLETKEQKISQKNRGNYV